MQADITNHIRGRIKNFEENLALIAQCRKKEMEKPYAKRDSKMLYMFHKDEALYKYCLTELHDILNRIV